jgi:hypothetical protein
MSYGMNQTHGRPVARTVTVTTTPTAVSGRVSLGGDSIHLQINPSTGVVRIYFSEAAFTANLDEFIELDAAASDFYEGPAFARDIWARGVGGDATFNVVAYLKIA